MTCYRLSPRPLSLLFFSDSVCRRRFRSSSIATASAERENGTRPRRISSVAARNRIRGPPTLLVTRSREYCNLPPATSVQMRKSASRMMCPYTSYPRLRARTSVFNASVRIWNSRARSSWYCSVGRNQAGSLLGKRKEHAYDRSSCTKRRLDFSTRFQQSRSSRGDTACHSVSERSLASRCARLRLR